MSLFKQLLPLEQVLISIREHFPGPGPLTMEDVNPLEALGRVLARKVVAPHDLPGFRRATVDGYAVRAADVARARDGEPVYLKLRGEVVMGQLPGFTLAAGEAAVIPTGGAVPPGADVVVMLEHTNLYPGEVEILKGAAQGTNIIEANDDVCQGQMVFAPHMFVRPEHVGFLCAMGVQRIPVKAPLRAVVFSTGDEIVPWHQTLAMGQVRDANGPMLAAALTGDGCQATYGGILSDDLEIVKKALKDSVERADIILISGGSSVGKGDVTAAAIQSLGPPGVLVHGVAIKPGKPTIIGKSHGGVPVLGMPGNPVSAQVIYKLIVRSILHRLLTGKDMPPQGTIAAILDRSLKGPSGRSEYVRVRLEQRADKFYAVPVLGESGLLSTLALADGIIMIPLNVVGLEAGEVVEVTPLGQGLS
jgi:molybdopterin molybdotransferase